MKLPKRRIRRNTVVIHKGGTFYGRVIRILPDGKVFWLCCGYHFHITPAEDLEVPGYKGTKVYRAGRVVHVYMTTLRNLKRRSRRYHYEFAHNTPLDYEHIQRS